MLRDIVPVTLSQLASLAEYFFLLNNFYVLCIVGLGSVLLVWRIWTFTIHPWLHPHEPRDIPYWVPGLGHSIAFFTSCDKPIEYGLKLTKRNHQPFAVKLFGIRLYVLTSPEDVTAAYKNTETLSWDYYMTQLMSAFGLDKAALRKVWHEPKPGDVSYYAPNVINPTHKSHVHFTEEMYQRQLLPGTNLSNLSLKITHYIDETLRWEALAGPATKDISESYIQLSLKAFCRENLIGMISKYMFGDKLNQMEPGITEYMVQFNDDAWMVLFRYPELMAPKMAKARRKIQEAFRKYIKIPREQRSDAMWGMQNIIAAQEQAGIAERDRTALLLLVYWAAGSNAVNTLFWTMTYLVHYPYLRKEIQEETKPAFQNGQMDISYLIDRCPRLEAFFLEVLRMINGALGVRQVMQTTEINGKILHPGNTLVIPFRKLHFDKAVWGETPEEFDPGRFLKDKSLSSHPSYRPFGGGVSYCPGRFLVRHQVFGFAATFLQRFDVELPNLPLPGGRLKAQSFPKLDSAKPSTGTMACIEDMDVIINVRKAS